MFDQSQKTGLEQTELDLKRQELKQSASGNGQKGMLLQCIELQK